MEAELKDAATEADDAGGTRHMKSCTDDSLPPPRRHNFPSTPAPLLRAPSHGRLPETCQTNILEAASHELGPKQQEGGDDQRGVTRLGLVRNEMQEWAKFFTSTAICARWLHTGFLGMSVDGGAFIWLSDFLTVLCWFSGRFFSFYLESFGFWFTKASRRFHEGRLWFKVGFAT